MSTDRSSATHRVDPAAVPRLTGDPMSCRAVAATLGMEAARLSTSLGSPVEEVSAAARELAALLVQYADEIDGARRDHQGAPDDPARYAARARAGRARRQLRDRCAALVARLPR
ncbi:hypothetical protein [Austwickia sp. TVS 96-490-7B]|uniref:hypothetical protein n=1 Tax=Austwickia sp. TVS 96-490-7B TaxID=2830843 RepID=UPI001C58BF8B|nr:hypothetical protein [Austwickia sp. TVS 96-490-7B]